MITNERVVPVNLIAGKEYVMRNGRRVYVKDNPHWQGAAKFPFCAMEGGVILVYLTPEGQADPAGGENEHDIMRPVYEAGQTYFTGDDRVVTVDWVDEGPTFYPLHGDNDESYTLDGKWLHTGSNTSSNALFDYVPDDHALAHAAEPAVKSSVGQVFSPTKEPAAPPEIPLLPPFTPFCVGTRVEVRLKSAEIVQATVMYEDATDVAIEFDPDYYHTGAWTCDGNVPSGRGWYVRRDAVLRVVSESETQAEAERSEPEALDADDIAEVWAAYRINPTIGIDLWIAARRLLKAAAKQ